MTMRAISFLLMLFVLILGGCQSKEQQTTYRTPPPAEPVPVPTPVTSDEFRRARIMADMLYEARVAYDNNQLMTPPGRSAYDRYREVLNFEPGNAVAQQGLVDIVLRYIELAQIEITQGEYDNAASLLERGARVLPDRPELADARSRLAVARQNKVETHTLDPDGVRNQSLETMTELADIAQDIRSREVNFLINARTDDEGRWIYKVMREAVGGYRLRGDIGISETPAILITVPATCAEATC
jgi:tetratricopeptide (TPR) repeat protein